jgi:hypothetical protein
MLLLLGGPYRAPARIVLGVIALVIGMLIHQILLILVGAVLIAWGAIGVLVMLRRRGRNRARAAQKNGNGWQGP